MADRMLQIERVRVSDEGVYVCRVENSVGWREAEAKLVVNCKTKRIPFLLYKGIGHNNSNINNNTKFIKRRNAVRRLQRRWRNR